MKENQENKKVEAKKEVNKKTTLIIFGVVIVLLIVAIGIAVGVKMKRLDVPDNNTVEGGEVINNNEEKEQVNYEDRGNGLKENRSEGIFGAEFDINGLRLSHLSIMEMDGRADITIEVANIVEEKVGAQDFTIKLFDDKGELMTEFPLHTEEIEPETIEMMHFTIEESCVNAKTVKIEAATVGEIEE